MDFGSQKDMESLSEGKIYWRLVVYIMMLLAPRNDVRVCGVA